MRVAPDARRKYLTWRRRVGSVEVPLVASELEAVPISQKDIGEGRGGEGKKIVKSSTKNEEEMAYPLEWDVTKETMVKMEWERVDVLDFFCLGVYLDAERLGVLPVKGRDFRVNAKGLIRLTAHVASNRQKCSSRQLQKPKVKVAMDLSFACDAGKLKFV